MTLKANSVDFVPSRDGFHFVNRFINVVLPKGLRDSFLEAVVGGFLGFLLGPFEAVGAAVGAVLGATTNISAGSGRCGGMCWLALDYWYAKLPIPTAMGSSQLNKSGFDDFSKDPNDVPSDGTPLSSAIYDREIDSLTTTNMWAQAGAWCINESDQDVGQKTTRNEFPRVVQAVDQGNPVVLSMITRNNDMGGLHQVVAFGYALANDGSMTINIYDPNYPDTDSIVLSARPNDPWDEIDTSVDPNSNQTAAIAADHHTPWKGWFVEEYASKPAPAPDIVIMDLAVNWVGSHIGPVKLGAPFLFGCRLGNNDEVYPAHAQRIRLLAENGGNIWVVQESNGFYRSMKPGWRIGIQIDMTSLQIPARAGGATFGNPPDVSLPVITGPVTFFVQYQTFQGHWITMPASSLPSDVAFFGVVNTISLPIEPAAFVDGPFVDSWTTEIDPSDNPVAKVVCSVTPYYFDGPTKVTWTVDGMNAGNGARVALPPIQLGRGAAFKPANTIVATVSSEGPPAQNLSEGVTFTIPELTVGLAFDALFSQAAVEQKVRSVLSVTDTAYTAIAIDAQVSDPIGNLTYTWTPPPAWVLNDGGIAIYKITPDSAGHSLTDYAGKSIAVSVKVSDQAERVASAQHSFSAVQTTIAPSSVITKPAASQSGPPRPQGGDPARTVVDDSRVLGLRVLGASGAGAIVKRVGATVTVKQIAQNDVTPGLAKVTTQ